MLRAGQNPWITARVLGIFCLQTTPSFHLSEGAWPTKTNRFGDPNRPVLFPFSYKLASAFPKRALWNPVVDLLRHQGAFNKRKEPQQHCRDNKVPASLDGQPLRFSLDPFCPPNCYLGSLCLVNLCNSLYSSQVLVPGSVRDGLACLGARRWQDICDCAGIWIVFLGPRQVSVQPACMCICTRKHTYARI